MKNSVRVLAAATALSVIAVPALAGYTIYEDDALPSVLFVEFDGPANPEATVISAPGLPGEALDLIDGEAGSPATGALDPDGFEIVDEEGQDGGFVDGADDAPSVDDEQADVDEEQEDTFAESVDGIIAIDNERIRDVIVDDIIRDEILSDTRLR